MPTTASAAAKSELSPSPYPLAAIDPRRGTRSVVSVRGRKIGDGRFVTIAGPCTVETPEQTLTVAHAVRAAGGRLLRGGAFKPRTSPYAFRGLGAEGLELLDEARSETGLPIVTELMDARDLDLVADVADMVQIGARNMQNYTLLREVGRAGVPVLIKRGIAATIDELLLAAEYVLNEGNGDVILCERGIRTFETSYRFTLDIAAIPVPKERTHLPVIVDPSHAAGRRSLVEPLSLAAAAAGADGVIVEVHPEPSDALCDDDQALAASELAGFIERVERVSLAAREPIVALSDAA
jgi:3-deoxy-7-phosphoheptulonate synthase